MVKRYGIALDHGLFRSFLPLDGWSFRREGEAGGHRKISGGAGSVRDGGIESDRAGLWLVHDAITSGTRGDPASLVPTIAPTKVNAIP